MKDDFYILKLFKIEKIRKKQKSSPVDKIINN